jgi:hypothetical protein
MGVNDQFALQKSRTADVRFGSKADIACSVAEGMSGPPDRPQSFTASTY